MGDTLALTTTSGQGSVVSGSHNTITTISNDPAVLAAAGDAITTEGAGVLAAAQNITGQGLQALGTQDANSLQILAALANGQNQSLQQTQNQALQTIATSTGDQIDQQAQSNSLTNQELQNALSANSLLAQNVQTGGAATDQAGTNKLVLTIGGLVVAAIALFLYLRKS